MANAITFDTLASAKKLIAAGFTQQQAEVQTEILAQMVDEQLVSRQYLDIRLSEMKTDIIKWVAAMLVAQAAIVATLVKLL